MSEQGWREFLAAEGVGDRVVLHGGATAVFRVPSLGAAVRIADASASRMAGTGVLLTLSDQRITVRLTRDLWALEARHSEMARAISAAARALDAVPDRAAAPGERIEWLDAMAGRPSRSLGADAHAPLLHAAGLTWVADAEVEGGNHYEFVEAH